MCSTGGPAHRHIDPEAQLFAAVYPSLRRFAAVTGSKHDDPDDLVQEAVARTLARSPLADLDDPLAYLRRVVVNLVIDRARSNAARQRKLPRLASSSETNDVYPSDLTDLEHLSPIQRAVLYLAEVDGLSLVEVGSALSITPVAARLHASRARRRLRGILQEER